MSGVKQPEGRVLDGCAPVPDQTPEENSLCPSSRWALVLADMRARMFFPDPVDAERYLHVMFGYVTAAAFVDADRSFTAAEINEAEADIEAYMDLDLEAHSAGARTPAKSGEERWIHAGLITAYILLIPLAVQARSGQKVGRRAAFRVLTAWLAERNGMIGAKERSLQEIWRRYQSVAHLWATYHIDKIFPKSEDDLICFLAVADHIRQLGESYRPERSKETLLDPRVTWRVAPELQLPEVTFDWSCIKLPEKWMHKATEACNDD